MKVPRSGILCGVALIMSAASSPARSLLFDFEDGTQISGWHDEHRESLGADKELHSSERFAADGRHSMRFTTPAWRPEDHGGRQKWPAFEGVSPISDWRGYDRLVFEIVNVTPSPQRLMLFITDSKVATRSGLHHRERIPPYGHVQAVMDLRKQFASKRVNAADIHMMHLYTEDPPCEMVVHLDRFLLLKPGEELPGYSQSFLADFAVLQAPALDSLGEDLRKGRQRLFERAKRHASVQAWITQELTALIHKGEALGKGDPARAEDVLSLPERLDELRQRAKWIESHLDLRLEFEEIRPTVQAKAADTEGVVVCFADSMSKVLPRAELSGVAVKRRTGLSLGLNETESLQVVVLPMEGNLSEVSVRFTELRGPNGSAFPPHCTEAAVVGYVLTESVPPYGSRHVGWWPDPILGFMRETSVSRGDAQSFWIRVRAPKDVLPGEYRGDLEVLSAGRPLFSFPFCVRVYGFSLPDVSPLPLAITFAPHDHPTTESREVQNRWRKRDSYPINAWRKHKSEWVDFLADYFITYDSLYEYGGWKPEFGELKRLQKAGRAGCFNLGYYAKCGSSEDARETWCRRTLDRLRPRYETAKSMGLLQHAYIYGCDEHKPTDFPNVQRAARLIKEAFPNVPVMTTTYDHSFGLDSVITSVDAWCPLTPRYDVDRAQKARAAGKQVWWYICCGPRHPHANMFVEYPAIEGRSLMGAMTAKYRPDGFLYYQISIWNSETCIESGPFTDWNPRSWTTYHGDGSWTCVGPDGTPLPTIRLENFRDGLEDYAYTRVLASTAEAVAGRDREATLDNEWLHTARKLLAVPEHVVRSKTDFTRDPAVLRAYRNDVADAIMRAPIPPVAPW